MNKSIDHEEWETLYQALGVVCARHGKEDPYGNGDYWVVDDCWGGVTQKVIVFSPRFLTPQLVAEISKCIGETGLLGAQVIVALDMNLPGGKLPPSGMVVDSHGAIEQWDLDLIRKRVGQYFYRESGHVVPFNRPLNRGN